MLYFQVMWIWPFRRVELCTKFGSNICYSHWDRRTYSSDFHLMTSRELTSGFDFWSRGHLRMAVMHLPIKFGADIFIWSDRVIDIFPKSKMAADAILNFQVMWIRLFRPVDSVVFVLCTKFGSNICYNHWDRRTYDSDFHLMTSRELTAGFDFWSRGHLRMAVLHRHIKFSAYTFIQSGVIVILKNSKWRPPPSWIFRLCEFGHSGVSTVWHLCSVLNLVQISVQISVTEIDALMLKTFIW